MAGFKYNPATGRFEVQQATNPTAGPATAKPTTVNIGKAKQTVQPIAAPKGTTPTPPADSGPKRNVQGPPSPYTGQYPRYNPPVETPAPTPDAQALIDAQWVAVQEEAAAYRSIYGEEPPASWWNARTAPIEATQKRLDASAKGGGSAAVKAETERIRNIQGGREAEKFLRGQAETRKAEMLKRVAELYDPQQTKNAEDLKTVLKQASDAYDLAEKQVGEAGTNFDKEFRGSTAYQGLPISAFSVADNPLIASLQQQGAGTGQVEAATNYARQFGQQTADLEKWAASQLGTAQSNYEAAAKNAASMGTAAALQGLAARRGDVKTGINQQFSDALAEIAKNRTQATSEVDTAIADILSKADTMRAETTSKYGKLPSEVKKKKK